MPKTISLKWSSLGKTHGCWYKHYTLCCMRAGDVWVYSVDNKSTNVWGSSNDSSPCKSLEDAKKRAKLALIKSLQQTT